MGIRMSDAMMRQMSELRYEPTERRVRAVLGGRTVIDTTRALLVWEPRRPVPSYAAPVDDVRVELVPADPAGAPASRAPILHPGIPFAVHSTAGEPLTVRAGDIQRVGAAFRPADRGLAGYVVFDFTAFDAWLEEDEPLVGHPRDPYHRVDARAASRHVRIESRGQLLAESSRPTLVFETNLPTRFYLPRDDVRAPVRPSRRITRCAYKGEANYLSFDVGDNLAWTYQRPLPDAAQLAGLVAFFDELVDVTVDGVHRKRSATAFAKAIREEFGNR